MVPWRGISRNLFGLLVPDLEEVLCCEFFLHCLVVDLDEDRAEGHGVVVVASVDNSEES